MSENGADRKPLLELRELSVAFGGLRAVDGLDLHVNEREIVSVIGPNGTARASSDFSRTRSPSEASRAPSRRCGCSST